MTTGDREKCKCPRPFRSRIYLQGGHVIDIKNEHFLDLAFGTVPEVLLAKTNADEALVHIPRDSIVVIEQRGKTIYESCASGRCGGRRSRED